MKTLGIIIGISMLLMAGTIGWLYQGNQGETFSSTPFASEYRSTVFTGTASSTLIQTGITTLGSIVITDQSTVGMTIYNATTTTDKAISPTTIATFEASATEGTYTFDAVLQDGLVIDSDSFDGSFTITHR